MIVSTPSSTLESAQLVDMRKAASLCGISVRTAWRLLSAGTFPKPIRLSERLVRWRVGDIVSWINAGGSVVVNE